MVRRGLYSTRCVGTLVDRYSPLKTSPGAGMDCGHVTFWYATVKVVLVDFVVVGLLSKLTIRLPVHSCRPA